MLFLCFWSGNIVEVTDSNWRKKEKFSLNETKIKVLNHNFLVLTSKEKPLWNFVYGTTRAEKEVLKSSSKVENLNFISTLLLLFLLLLNLPYFFSGASTNILLRRCLREIIIKKRKTEKLSRDEINLEKTEKFRLKRIFNNKTQWWWKNLIKSISFSPGFTVALHFVCLFDNCWQNIEKSKKNNIRYRIINDFSCFLWSYQTKRKRFLNQKGWERKVSLRDTRW